MWYMIAPTAAVGLAEGPAARARVLGARREGGMVALLHEGQVLRDTYTVERFLGEGAFAEVYRVQHRFLGRQAMKVFKAQGATQDEIEQMMGEAKLLSRIGHPNIIRIFDANVLELASGRFGFFTMEYVPAGSLDRYWRSRGDTLAVVKEAVAPMTQVCAGISVAHGERPPIVHRDLKPQNILVAQGEEGPRALVSDFGLAKRVNPLTLLASAQGTLSFKPPEFLDDMDSPAGDVWALGTTLYLLLTDTLPFPEPPNDQPLDRKRFEQALRPPSIYNIQVDAELDAIVCRCLALEPAKRYANAQPLLAALRRWLSRCLEDAPDAKPEPQPSVGESTPEGDADEAEHMVRKAIELAKQPGSLNQAAEMLEEAIRRAPRMAERYRTRIDLWRRGIAM